MCGQKCLESPLHEMIATTKTASKSDWSHPNACISRIAVWDHDCQNSSVHMHKPHLNWLPEGVYVVAHSHLSCCVGTLLSVPKSG